MNKYIVNSPLNHDNRPYAIGDTVEMSEEQAAHLVELGRITLDAREPAPEQKPEVPQAPEEVEPVAAAEPVAVAEEDVRPEAKSSKKRVAKTAQS